MGGAAALRSRADVGRARTQGRARAGNGAGGRGGGGVSAPPLVTLTLWGVPPAAVPAATLRMALDRRHLRRVPGLRFAKLLGTGDGRTFTLRDADPLHWALLTVWDGDASADRFATTTPHRRWNTISDERLDVRMSPLASRGRWAGQEPFTSTGARPE